jgi:hypothetical protein
MYFTWWTKKIPKNHKLLVLKIYIKKIYISYKWLRKFPLCKRLGTYFQKKASHDGPTSGNLGSA